MHSRIQFGDDGPRVSRIALGSAALGLDYGIAQTRPSASGAERLLGRVLDLGINFIDTARAYGDSESLIGRALGGVRHEVVIATKVKPGVAASVRESIETSLRELRKDVLDIVQIHCGPDDNAPDAATTEILLALQQAGHIRMLGASVYTNTAALATVRSKAFGCVQIPWSALDRRPEAEVLPAAAHAGVLIRSALLKGALTARYTLLPESLEPLKAQVRRLESIATREGIELPELAWRYVAEPAANRVLLSGAISPEQLEQAIAWTVRGPLPANVLEEIRQLEPLDAAQVNPAKWET